MNKKQIFNAVKAAISYRVERYPSKPAERRQLAVRVTEEVSKLKGPSARQIKAIVETLAITERSELRRREAQPPGDNAQAS